MERVRRGENVLIGGSVMRVCEDRVVGRCA